MTDDPIDRQIACTNAMLLEMERMLDRANASGWTTAEALAAIASIALGVLAENAGPAAARDVLQLLEAEFRGDS